MNYTNPGAISHNEIMELYKSYVDPTLTWKNFTVEEQAKVIVAPRSNNLMDTARIESEFPEILPIRESLIKYVFEPAAAEKEKVAAAVREMRGGRVHSAARSNKQKKTGGSERNRERVMSFRSFKKKTKKKNGPL